MLIVHVRKKRTAAKSTNGKEFTAKNVQSFDESCQTVTFGTMYRCPVILIFILISSQGYCTLNDSSLRISTLFSYHPIDLQHRVQLHYSAKKVESTITIAYGINRSIFQSRLFPTLGLNSGIRIIEHENRHLTLGIAYFFSFVKLAKHYTTWHEPGIFYRFRFGNRWGLIQESFIGLRTENFRNQFTLDRSSVNTLSFHISIGVSYAL